MANIQIPEELFFKLLRFHCLSDELDQELQQEISKELELKLDKMAMRYTYTESKTAATLEEREKARQKYLDMRGIHKDFRW